MTRRSVMGQIVGYVRAEGKWLLLPVFAILLAIGVLLAIAATSALAPFIYPAF